MTVNEMMQVIATKPEAIAMADRMLSNYERELSFSEVIALVYDRYFNRKEAHENV